MHAPALAPNATKEQWSALAEQAAAAGGLAPGRDLFGVDDTLLSAPLRNSMDTLYELFSQAPVLGSLIDPHALEADFFQRDFESIRDLFAIVLKQERGSDEEIERAVAACGMAQAAQLLADRYTLVITNVPYLARGKQGQALRVFCERNYPRSKNDLATAFSGALSPSVRRGRNRQPRAAAELVVPHFVPNAPATVAGRRRRGECLLGWVQGHSKLSLAKWSRRFCSR